MQNYYNAQSMIVLTQFNSFYQLKQKYESPRDKSYAFQKAVLKKLFFEKLSF